MSSDDTPRWGTGPDVYERNVRDVIRACDAAIAPLETLKARAELLLVGLASWRTSYVPPDDRARDVNTVFDLLDAAKKIGAMK